MWKPSQASVTLDEFKDTEDFEKICKGVRTLPERVALLVDLDRQGFNDSFIVLPDKVQARLDRQEVPPYLLRKGLIVSSGIDLVHQGDFWYVHPNEGQWWGSEEVEELGFTIPKNFQLRFYGAHSKSGVNIEDHILLKCS